MRKCKAVRFPAGQYRAGMVVYEQEVPERPVPEVLKGLVMPALTLTPLVSAGRGRTPLDEIDQDVIDTLEEAWDYNQANPSHRLSTPPFETKDEAEDWLRDLRAAAYYRKDSKGRLVVTGNPAGNDDKGYVIRFRVAEYAE